MKSKVLELYDYHLSDIPAEFTHWRVSDAEMEELLQGIASRSSYMEIVDTVENGDGVLCHCVGDTSLNGRTIVLLYPGQNLPGAEVAEQAVLNRHAGEVFAAQIGGKELKLEIKEIRRVRAGGAICDAMIAADGIEGVSTVEEYKAWYRTQNEPMRRDNKAWQVHAFWCREMANKSVIEFDEEERKYHVERGARRTYDLAIMDGQNPCISDNGDLLTEEEAIAKFYPEQDLLYRMELTDRELIRRLGFEHTAEEGAKHMAEMLREYGMPQEEYLALLHMTYEEACDFVAYEMGGQEMAKVMGAEAEKYLEV